MKSAKFPNNGPCLFGCARINLKSSRWKIRRELLCWSGRVRKGKRLQEIITSLVNLDNRSCLNNLFQNISVIFQWLRRKETMCLRYRRRRTQPGNCLGWWKLKSRRRAVFLLICQHCHKRNILTSGKERYSISKLYYEKKNYALCVYGAFINGLQQKQRQRQFRRQLMDFWKHLLQGIYSSIYQRRWGIQPGSFSSR